MTAFWIPTLIPAALVVAWTFVAQVRRTFQRRPAARTSARDRLIDLNPTLQVANVRWNVASRRIRLGWVTRVAVGVAFVVATNRPVTPVRS